VAPPCTDDRIEIELANGRLVRVGAGIDAAALKRILDVLESYLPSSARSTEPIPPSALPSGRTDRDRLLPRSRSGYALNVLNSLRKTLSPKRSNIASSAGPR
jgi:hypothetical protein